jgi:hypothetical protein
MQQGWCTQPTVINRRQRQQWRRQQQQGAAQGKQLIACQGA